MASHGDPIHDQNPGFGFNCFGDGALEQESRLFWQKQLYTSGRRRSASGGRRRSSHSGRRGKSSFLEEEDLRLEEDGPLWEEVDEDLPLLEDEANQLF